MAIKNLMEDIVASVAKEMLKKESVLPDTEMYEQDVIAYVLNRVPPRYITSERGVIHGKLETRFTFQQRTDILFLINEAVQTIRQRRASSHSVHDEMTKKQHVFPHIMGEVLEETTFSIVPEVEVTLMYKDKPARMIDESWENPYTTNKATRGYFHFWPDYVPEEMDETKSIPFKIVFTSPRFDKKEIDFSLKVFNTINLYESRIIPITLLQIKEGVDISFLYE